MSKVTAALIEREGKILIAKRKLSDTRGGKWEFPGGTLHSDETLQECLKRELKEELNIETEIGELIITSKHDYGDIQVEILLYKTTYLSGIIEVREHEEIAWVLPKDLPKYDFVEADKPIVKRLTKGW